ncbi:MAG: glycosyltransferase family 4 protein [Flavobacteriales bacterium]|nr:glycosyltransferase family 4 protein [Flavobacteriales bacterium]
MGEQLNRFGVLQTFFTSYAYQKNTGFRKIAKRVDKENIDAQRFKTHILLAVFIKALPNYSHFWNTLFDRWVARKIKRSDASIFIGWSGMSLHSLRAAKKKGMITILERGSSHISYQNEILSAEYQKFDIDFSINPRVIKKEEAEYAEVDYISIPSLFVKNSFIEKGVNPAKLVLNNYGVSGYFSPPKDQPKNDKFTILYLGSLSVRKGLIYMFEALNKLNIPATDYEVWFVGSISDEVLNEKLKSFDKTNWKFWGHVNHYEVAELIAKTHVAVHPSLEEGLSTVIPQIMACEVPVISTTNTGGEDLITDKENGFIVPIRDSQAIANCIEYLYHHPVIYKKMVSDLKKTIPNLTWNSYGERYHHFLYNLIKSA